MAAQATMASPLDEPGIPRALALGASRGQTTSSGPLALELVEIGLCEQPGDALPQLERRLALWHLGDNGPEQAEAAALQDHPGHAERAVLLLGFAVLGQGLLLGRDIIQGLAQQG